MKKLLNSWVLFGFSLFFISGAFAQEKKLNLGGISITGGGLQLIGTISTASFDDKRVRYAGWALIVTGFLVNSGDLSAQNMPTDTLNSEDVFEEMILDARATLRSPSITSGEAISNAINNFDYDKSATYDEKAKAFSSLVLKVNQMKEAGVEIENREESIRALLGKDATENNIKTFTNLYALAGL